MKKYSLPTNNSSTLNYKPIFVKGLFLHLAFASIVFIVLFGSGSTLLAQSWSQQSSLPTSYDLDGVYFFSQTEGFICGDDQVLMHTTDGGTTWVQVTGVSRDRLFVEQEFHDLSFADSLHGWAVGNDNYLTTDGGDTWQEMASAGGNNKQIHPITADTAYLNSTWEMQKTTDGGVNWFRIFPASGGDRVNTMDWWDGSLGAFWGGGHATGSLSGLRVTTDGGDSWNLVREGITKDVTFVTSDILLWHDSYGLTLYRSDDQGQTADTVLTVVDLPIEIIHRIPGGRILVVDAAVRMWMSEDDGLTWNNVHGKIGARGLQYPGIYFLDSLNGWFVTEDALMLQTTDGGYTWTQLQSGIGASLEDVTMYSSGRGVAVGDNGAVLVTDDFGEQWRIRPIIHGPGGISIDLVDLAPAGPNLFAVSKTGLVYSSDDSGDTWTMIPPGNTYSQNYIMYVLDFPADQTGFMFGRSYDYGLVFRTQDGGQTWQPRMVANDYEALQLDAEMFDLNNGVSVGTANSFYFTEDGWQTWTRRAISPSSSWHSIGFANLQEGWVGSYYGEVAHTTDTGSTWSSVSLPGVTTDDIIEAIEVKSVNEIYILVSSFDVVRVFESFDGGQTWQLSDPGIVSPDRQCNANNFFVNSSGDIWTAGRFGFILAENSALLPVSYIQFDVSKLDDRSLLSWETANEVNNDRFEVEHSIDAINFKQIASVAGKGTTSEKQSYEFVHKNPAHGINYYRLKQVDHDGHFEYSIIRAIIFDDIDVEYSFSVFPNPTTGIIQIELLNEKDLSNETIKLILHNSIGEVVLESDYHSNKQIDISNFASGFYVLIIENSKGDVLDVKRIVK